MKCENCGKNPATIHAKITINGVTTEKMLCESCWAQENGMPAMGFTVNDLLKGFMQSGTPVSQTSPRCDACGMDLKTFTQTGLLGCAHCYETFRPYLNATLKKIHGTLRHQGSRPGQKPAAPAPAQTTLQELKASLSSAIASERYEEAAVLRDRIRLLEESHPPREESK
jgi:protein arginine kinase activator